MVQAAGTTRWSPEHPSDVAMEHAACPPAEHAAVVVLGLRGVAPERWDVLRDAGVRLVPAGGVDDAVRAVAAEGVPVVLAEAHVARPLVAALRSRRELAATHVVIAAALDAPHELQAALEAGADDVIRVPFAPQVLAARVAAGLRAARLRANEALLRSMVVNIPGALYRCACDSDWTMEWISDEVERISGHPASDFIDNAVRTFASVIHAEDREQVERSVMEGVDAGRPFTLEYRIVRDDGEVRWVLERGQCQTAGDGRRWLDGAIFDITARRAAEQALREREIVEAQLAEVWASRARIVEAADRARREIERNLHDGAQQRFVSIALQLQLWLATHPDLGDASRASLEAVAAELRAGLAELRDLAHGLHPAVLTERGLGDAIVSLVNSCPVPVVVRVDLPEARLPISAEAAAYYTVSEALTNIAKYAGATEAWVDVARRDGTLAVEVRDDGAGGADPGAGSGLEGLRDRVAAVGGALEVVSPPGRGTTVRARLPV